MHYYLSKRWRLKFRRDPDAGRVLFIGPLVVSIDVARRNRSLRDALQRANSHLRYWHYRRGLANGGPTLMSACGQWARRLAFEWLGLGRGA